MRLEKWGDASWPEESRNEEGSSAETISSSEEEAAFQIAVGDDVMRDEKEHIRRASISQSCRRDWHYGINEPVYKNEQ